MAMARYLTLILVALALATLTIPSIAAMTVKEVHIVVDIEKPGKYVSIDYELIMTITNINDTEIVVYLPTLLSKPKLKSYECIVDGKNIAANAKLVTEGIQRVVLKLSEPIGDKVATLRIVVEGYVKSTSKLYATKDYKFYKDYKPISNKILYLQIANYFPDTAWGKLYVTVKAPKGWDIFYARSSISSKVRYMDIKRVYREDGRGIVEIWYLSTKKIAPTKFSPGKVFEVEVGILPITDYTTPLGAMFLAILVILAAFFAWYYRDVWKYVPKSVG